MKKIITFSLLLISMTTFSQKVKFKKGNIFVDNINWGTYEKIGTANKEIYSTLNGDEYLSVNYLSCGTGEYYKGGKGGNENIEKKIFYQEIHFFNTEIERFEVCLGYKDLIRVLIKEKVIENGVFNIDNAKKFKNKYEELASDKCKGNKTVIINTNCPFRMSL